MNNMLYKDQYDGIASEIGVKLRVGEFLENVPSENYFECDTFEGFDRNIIKAMAAGLMTSEEPFSVEYREIIRNRSSKKHFSAKYQHYYKALSGLLYGL
jgi:hypothetical protein